MTACGLDGALRSSGDSLQHTDARLVYMRDGTQKPYQLAEIRTASERLSELTYPSLERPPVAYGSPPTPDLLNWAVRLYCCSLLSHLSEMLRSFLLLLDNGHLPASFVVCRCLSTRWVPTRITS